ncbi:predicted protein [Streptomyces sp. AA4]|nr:predicted protein [Streptomyces sp. AA4]
MLGGDGALFAVSDRPGTGHAAGVPPDRLVAAGPDGIRLEAVEDPQSRGGCPEAHAGREPVETLRRQPCAQTAAHVQPRRLAIGRRRPGPVVVEDIDQRGPIGQGSGGESVDAVREMVVGEESHRKQRLRPTVARHRRAGSTARPGNRRGCGRSGPGTRRWG